MWFHLCGNGLGETTNGCDGQTSAYFWPHVFGLQRAWIPRLVLDVLITQGGPTQYNTGGGFNAVSAQCMMVCCGVWHKDVSSRSLKCFKAPVD